MVPMKRLNHRGSIAVNTTVVQYSKMSRDDPQFKLRLPAELKARIDREAEASRRSINAEIIARLELALLSGEAADELIPAVKAKEISIEARQSIPGIVKRRIIEGINRAMSLGHSTAGIELDDLELDALPQADTEQLISTFTDWLADAGYDVEWDGPERIWIRFDDL